MNADYLQVVKSTLDSEASFLNHISQEIWKNPELKHEETFAHDLLTKALQEKGFTVEKHYVLPTAFRAEYTSRNLGATVALICEYDALPNIGHACGHNLIAESGLAAAIAVKAAMEADENIAGKVVVLGTPAEEGGGGKIDLINAGAFKDIDVAVMVHPSPNDHLYPPFLALQRVTVNYTGKEAHASGYPWEGINALDAAVSCYNNVSCLRQHIKPYCRVHGIIINGGEAPNIIPGHSEVQFYYRAPSIHEMERLKMQLENCFKSAAISTGCQIKIDYPDSNCYDSLITNKTLAELYKKYATASGVNFEDGNPQVIPFMASSDMGNVSHVVPSIHPTYSIGTKSANHSVAFAAAAGAPAAQSPTLIAARSMALLTLNVLCDDKVLQAAKLQFLKDIKNDAVQG